MKCLGLLHCFERPLGLKLSLIYNAVHDFTSRLKWAWVFRQSVDDAAYQPPLFKRHVSTCNKVVDAEISGFAESVSSCVVGRYKESHRRGSYSLPLFVKAALAWLRSN